MSIVIKGMEMPESCKDCQLCVGIPLGSELVYHKCLPLNRLASKRSRRGECPLIEVPTPHGRLIDADAVFKNASKTALGNTGFVHIKTISDAPTVIEAEADE